MKKILHATDYSVNAISALKYAINLSKKLNTSLFVIHVFDFPSIFDKELKVSHTNLEEKGYITQQNKLIKFCNKHYEGDLDALDICFEAIENKSIVNGIIKKAKKLEADLIITGTKSEKLFKELFLGNTSKQLIEKAPCPVLTIPKEHNIKSINTIVYASDFEENDICAIYDLVNIAKSYDATIKIVHISSDHDKEVEEKTAWFLELLKEKIKYNKIDTDIIYSNTIFSTLKKYLADENADMVTMLERNSKGIMKTLFHVDLVKKMETSSTIPLMSFNENWL